MHQFYYRYVGFGTRFESAIGARSGLERNLAHPGQLYDNELAADVGSQCMFDQQGLRVLDHHFRGGDTGPSASAAVLQHADQIRTWGESLGENPVWLITHQTPDFDAYCSLYLARKILEDEITPVPIPERWDWFNPAPSLPKPEQQLWPMLLAAYASTVDHGKPLRCPAEKRVHAVLYAALRRGRKLEPGAVDFFDAVREAIEQRGLNPLFDSLFDQQSKFGAESAFLEGDRNAYQRDFRRGRRANVTVLRAPRPFAEWFPELEKKPLLDNPEIHLSPPGHQRERVEGLFLRDPESVLFKEWAREDAEHAANGVGFLFTAVCYSGSLANAAYGNSSRYIVALDPERAAGRHLYHLWAALQTAEFREQGAASPPEGVPRPDFLGRKVGPDPWYDGNTYAATIVDTPRQGTRLRSEGGPGLQSRKAHTVEGVLASSLERFWIEASQHPLTVEDFPCTETAQAVFGSAAGRSVEHLGLYGLADLHIGRGCFRFASVELDEAINPLNPLDASQIGRTLWPLLEERGIKSVPADFESRHLVCGPASLAIWNRRGIAVAWRRADAPDGPDGRAVCETLKHQLKVLASLTCKIEDYVRALQAPEAVDSHETPTLRPPVEEGRALVIQVALLQNEAARPDGGVLRRLLETSKFGEVASSLHNLHQQSVLAEAAIQAEHNVGAIRDTQDKIEWVEIFLVGVYSVYLIHYLGEGFRFNEGGDYVGWCILGGTTFASGLAYLLLRPHVRKAGRRIALAVLALIGLLLAAYISVGMVLRSHAHHHGGAKNTEGQVSGTHPS